MSDPSKLRAADSEREALADELRQHMLAGRLAPEECEERVGAACGASTRADLDARSTRRTVRERRHSERRLPQ
jgi:hypothetical protein